MTAQQASKRRYYEAHREVVKAKAAARGRTAEGQAYHRDRHAKRRAFLTHLKAWSPCGDCGGTFHPAAMQWDHRPGEGKARCAGNMWAAPLEAIHTEIAKCDLVCANCHAVRTFERRRTGV